MPKPYQHLLFDLDHTLWDYEKNARDTLSELYSHFKLQDRSSFTKESLTEKFYQVNHRLWDQYNKGEIDSKTLRNTRFRLVLAEQSILSYSEIGEFSNAYLMECPKKGALINGALELLDYLKGKYILHIITNGFENTQKTKIDHAKIGSFFNEVITSERAKAKKPNHRIFEYTLAITGAQPESTIIIGDNFEADIAGAKNAGIDQIYFNPERKKQRFTPSYDISALSDISSIL